ncbi:MAG TPA: RNA 2',3'-cyclic phosphodiesterase [Alphaproteobacteria bacterium]|jgi:2'-5' RNA ligase|nr:RNA 2',3'-cyclic phosphodiesterase [Alphaproteobacteria bacterium]HBA43074.1 RNA 2',3'-cyclic phosphodiesterase [Alphaproteobacteria bacterium]
MARIFVAIGLPSELQQRLGLICGGIPGARWISPERLHLTLRFIGEVSHERLRDIDHALAGIDFLPFDLRLDGIGQFGGDKPRVLWAGVAPNPELMRLHERVNLALARAGVPPDTRRYVPHVTLARLKFAARDRLGGFIAHNNMLGFGAFAVEEFLLMSSHQSRDGTHYRVEQRYQAQVFADYG